MKAPPPLWRVWLLAARPKTLPAAVVPVLVGAAFAVRARAFEWTPGLLCLGFALLVQIGTNYANDYFDFIQGADTVARVGPARAVAAGWVSPTAMRRAMGVVFLLAFAVGLGLIGYGGWGLLPVGVACIACGIGYTGGPYPLGYHGLGDVFVVLFFGLVAVGGTFWVQTRTLTVEVLLAALAVGLLAANLLVANNYRDRATDALAGKRTLVVRLGERAGRWQYGLSVGVSLVVPGVLWARGEGVEVLLPWIVAPLGGWGCRALRPEATPAALIRLLALTAAYLALYGVLLAIGVGLGAR